MSQPPPGGGYSRERLAGEGDYPPVPLVSSPDGPPPRSRGSIWENTASQSLVVLSYDYFLHDYFSN